jgi:hypothetical protein
MKALKLKSIKLISLKDLDYFYTVGSCFERRFYKEKRGSQSFPSK